MKKRILFSASLFHAINDVATVTVPMVFPLLYSQQFIIKKYSHIGILSNLGLLVTFFFQFFIAFIARRFEYRNMLLFSFAGISFSLVLITTSWSFASLLILYLIMRVFVSFYHPIGISMVSKTHPNQAIDFAMGIQSGSGNLGVFIAFISIGYLAQSFGWKTPLYVWAFIIFFVGSLSYLSVRNISTREEEAIKRDFSSWGEAFKEIKKYIIGFAFGGACWATTVFYAPSLLNHKYHVLLGNTGAYLALWIGIGTIMTYLFGYLSRRIGRWNISFFGFVGSSLFLLLLGAIPIMEFAVVSLLLLGTFLFLIFPAFQSYVGNEVSTKNQTLAFSITSNIQMLSGSIIVLISGFLSDKFGINTPFIFLAIIGAFVSMYYFYQRPQYKL